MKLYAQNRERELDDFDENVKISFCSFGIQPGTRLIIGGEVYGAWVSEMHAVQAVADAYRANFWNASEWTLKTTAEVEHKWLDECIDYDCEIYLTCGRGSVWMSPEVFETLQLIRPDFERVAGAPSVRVVRSIAETLADYPPTDQVTAALDVVCQLLVLCKLYPDYCWTIGRHVVKRIATSKL